MPEKVLLVGPVQGRLTELISKVSAIQSKHGPFAALFILGDLFHPSPTESHLAQQTDLLQAKLQLPIPTFFYQGSVSPPTFLADTIATVSQEPLTDVPQGLVRVTDNLFYATGKSGVFVTQHGFRVAFVGGVWDAKSYAEDGAEKQFDADTWYESELQRSQDEALAHITPATIHRLLAHPSLRLPSTPLSPCTTTPANAGAKQGSLAAARASASADQARSAAQTAAMETLNARPAVDLLLTNGWPTGVTLFSPDGIPDPTARMWGSPAIARVASHACPRYHFSLAPSSTDSDLPVGIEPETLEMGAFWERAPYVTDLSSALANRGQLLESPAGRRQVEKLKSVTRFVSLARFANEKKKRWFLALNLTPADQQQEPAVALPGNATQTPYSVPGAASTAGSQSGKRSAPQQPTDDQAPNFRFQETKRARGDDVPPKGYVCRICNVGGHFIRACPQKQQQPGASTTTDTASNPSTVERSQMPLPAGLPSKPASLHHQRTMIPVGPSNCWFCLSNPNVAKSLIVSIGAESYVVFPKGAFVHPSISRVPVDAGHVLVVPLSHTSNLLPGIGGTGEEEEERSRTRAEMQATKRSVHDVWAQTGHAMLEWTLVRVKSSRMTHLQTQLVALLTDVVDSHSLVRTLDDALQSTKPPRGILRADDAAAFFDHPDAELDGYFHLALHRAGEKSEWLVPLSVQCRFPVQFVRATLARVFELPQLADWKTAVTEESEEVERQRSAAFRAALSA